MGFPKPLCPQPGCEESPMQNQNHFPSTNGSSVLVLAFVFGFMVKLLDGFILLDGFMLLLCSFVLFSCIRCLRICCSFCVRWSFGSAFIDDEKKWGRKRESGQVLYGLIVRDSRSLSESFSLANKVEIPLNVIYFLRLNTNARLRLKT